LRRKKMRVLCYWGYDGNCTIDEFGFNYPEIDGIIPVINVPKAREPEKIEPAIRDFIALKIKEKADSVKIITYSEVVVDLLRMMMVDTTITELLFITKSRKIKCNSSGILNEYPEGFCNLGINIRKRIENALNEF
jgi:hypothetical protein